MNLGLEEIFPSSRWHEIEARSLKADILAPRLRGGGGGIIYVSSYFSLICPCFVSILVNDMKKKIRI